MRAWCRRRYSDIAAYHSARHGTADESFRGVISSMAVFACVNKRLFHTARLFWSARSPSAPQIEVGSVEVIRRLKRERKVST